MGCSVEVSSLEASVENQRERQIRDAADRIASHLEARGWEFMFVDAVRTCAATVLREMASEPKKPPATDGAKFGHWVDDIQFAWFDERFCGMRLPDTSETLDVDRVERAIQNVGSLGKTVVMTSLYIVFHVRHGGMGRDVIEHCVRDEIRAADMQRRGYHKEAAHA